MIKFFLHLFAITLLLSLVSGCIGYIHVSPTECSADLPIVDYVYEKDNWGPINKNTMTINKLPEKDEFIKRWGEPDELVKISDDEITLVYQRKIWCGGVPVYILPAPLVLPTCEGFDRITFKGDKATHIHFKRADASGIVFPFLAGDSRSCPHTYKSLSNSLVPTYSKQDNIPDNTGLVVLYRPKSMLGGANMHIIMVEDNLYVPLYNGSYHSFTTTAGEKEFSVQSFFGVKSVKVDIKSGKKHYIEFGVGFFRMILEEVPADIAEKKVADLALSIP